jgi:hypothetical protein
MCPPLRFALTAALLLACRQPGLAAQKDVATYHGDSFRTGWLSHETTLTAKNVGGGSFGLLQTIPLDGRVDAEPLFLSQQPIPGKGSHDVLFVATENDSLYALDAASGATLWVRSFGTAVPDSFKQDDDNVFPMMGILSTPTIDRAAKRLYLVADTVAGNTDVFTLHAVSLATGGDVATPVQIAITAQLQGGGTWTFDPKYHLQRPALLESNGSIYIAFGSTADISPQISRGLILRYDATTLAPENGQLTDKLNAKKRNRSPFYLSSIWQSGYGPSADESGNVLFSTGNSDWHKPSYDPLYNLPDSVVELSPDLTAVVQSFTPSTYFQLDQADEDLGSGGTMVIPTQPGPVPHLAVAGGKDGRALLLDRDDFGGYTKGGPDRILQATSMGNCFCGPAYFVGSDGVPRIVTGGYNGTQIFKLGGGSTPQLTLEAATAQNTVTGLPDNGGVIPTVSSNGTRAGTAVLWYVQRPPTSSDIDPGTPLTLWAFDVTNLSTPLFSAQAGTWTHAVGSNADLVPTVANGRVYVASNQQLQIFGLTGAR